MRAAFGPLLGGCSGEPSFGPSWEIGDSTLPLMDRAERRETSAAAVQRVLDSLTDAGVETWVSGGWGVDALVGRQTRPHRDIDLLVPLRHTLQAYEALSGAGFWLVTDWFPTRFEVVDDDGAAVDVHPIRFDRDGAARLELPDGGWWHFDAESMDGRGVIGGRTVRCMSVDQQVRNHTGYEASDSDRHDMAVLVERFGIQAPTSYL